jgi:hypothetical protein
MCKSNVLYSHVSEAAAIAGRSKIIRSPCGYRRTELATAPPRRRAADVLRQPLVPWRAAQW